MRCGRNCGHSLSQILTAKVGIHTDPVATLDFVSLYPSIMQAHNLCPSTWVVEPQYAALLGVEYETFTWLDDGGNTCSGTFVQNPEGIVSGMLKQLTLSRKWAKKMMAQAPKGSFEQKNFNSCQLAFKVTMNSAYGALGTSTGLLPAKVIAATVTSIGRRMIAATKEFIETTHEGSKVIYGDSVPADEPSLCRMGDGRIAVLRVDEMVERDSTWQPMCDKEWNRPLEGLEVWSDTGFTRVEKVIRHRLAPGKKMFEIQSDCGIVQATEDHSLLKYGKDGEALEVRPIELASGDELLNRSVKGARSARCSSSIPLDVAFHLGTSSPTAKIQ